MGETEEDAGGGLVPAWLRGAEGPAAALIAGRDWHAHPLGAPAGWPLALRVLMGTILGAPEPMHLVWGPARTFLFNDAYAAVLGERAEAAMGAPFEQVWPDGWPALQAPLASGRWRGRRCASSIGRSAQAGGLSPIRPPATRRGWCAASSAPRSKRPNRCAPATRCRQRSGARVRTCSARRPG